MTVMLVHIKDHPNTFELIDQDTGKARAYNLRLDEARAQLVKFNNPDLYAYCHQWHTDHIKDLPWTTFTAADPRWQRAVWLLHIGDVTPNGSPLDYYVQSQTAHNIKYRVRLGNGPSNPTDNWLCTMDEHPNRGKIHDWCPDAHPDYGRAPDLGHGKRCKHQIAAAIAHQFPEVLKLTYEEAPTAATVEAPEIPPDSPAKEDLNTHSSTDWARIKAWAKAVTDETP